jgi:hypothetical protein
MGSIFPLDRASNELQWLTQIDAENVRQGVLVRQKPGSEVVGLVRPDAPRVNPLQPAELIHPATPTLCRSEIGFGSLTCMFRQLSGTG